MALALIDTSGSQLKFVPDKPKVGEATIASQLEIIHGKDIDIPNTVSNSGTYIVTSIGYNAFASDNPNTFLDSVIIPASVTSIGAFAFQFNDLTKVIIPDSVETIGDGAFDNNALINVTISNSVRSIGLGAFAVNKLTSATFLGNFGTFDLNMFFGNADLTLITYCQGATGWDNPQRTFNIGPFDDPVDLKATSTVCAPAAATPVPTSPLWLLGMMAALLSLVAVRKLRKA